jgi:hypothetical protein
MNLFHKVAVILPIDLQCESHLTLGPSYLSHDIVPTE